MLTISDLTVEYQSKEEVKVAVDHLSLEIPRIGDTLGIVGESGSGKTTLGMSIMNVIEPPGHIVSGKVEYMGNNVIEMDEQALRKYRWNEVSMVYQSAMNSLNPVKTIAGHIVEVLQEHTRISRKDAREKALRMLSKVGIESDRADDYPHEFSGGMRQRAVIAMSLVLSPKLLIADEPTSALDVVIQKQILSLLKSEVEENNLSLVFITHEIAILSRLVDYVAVMYQGEIVEEGPIDKVFFEPLHPYTEMLLGSLLSLESKRELLYGQSISEKYELVSESSCKYVNFCKYAFDRCKHERPRLKESQQGRNVACHRYD